MLLSLKKKIDCNVQLKIYRILKRIFKARGSPRFISLNRHLFLPFWTIIFRKYQRTRKKDLLNPPFYTSLQSNHYLIGISLKRSVYDSILINVKYFLQGYCKTSLDIIHVTPNARFHYPSLFSNSPSFECVETKSVDFLITSFSLLRKMTFCNLKSVFISTSGLSDLTSFHNLSEDIAFALETSLIPRIVIFGYSEDSSDLSAITKIILPPLLFKFPCNVLRV